VTPLCQFSLSCNFGISCQNSSRFDGEVEYKVPIHSMENRQQGRGKHAHLEERQCELNHLSVAENSDRLEQGHKSAATQSFTGPSTPGNILYFFSAKYTGSFNCVVTLGQVIAFLPWWGPSGICAEPLSSQEEITSCPLFLGLLVHVY